MNDQSGSSKARRVRALFDQAAERYDAMNDVLGGGVHRLWAGALIDWLAPHPHMRLLDAAGGTGDIAFRFLERTGHRGTAIVCDINEKMLGVGLKRARDRGIVSGLDWLCGDAQALPVDSASVDAYTIAYGLRNVTDVEAVLAEARRVLKPGGRFICLDFSHVALPMLERPYRLYRDQLLPRVAPLMGIDGAEYLVESIRSFPNQGKLSEALAAAGFGLVKYRNLFGGMAALHSAWRI
jgi:demethylmenaquinone methyltransferase/2-methoxy-6-polyprenyl-1,4-benzoquinol methylase